LDNTSDILTHCREYYAHLLCVISRSHKVEQLSATRKRQIIALLSELLAVQAGPSSQVTTPPAIGLALLGMAPDANSTEHGIITHTSYCNTLNTTGLGTKNGC
jgi:hypothetical protein